MPSAPPLRRPGRLRAALLAGTVLLAAAAPLRSLAEAPDPLEQGFRDPPAEARPLTWWHWMNGNVTREGITRDLEWMKRAGLSGFQLFDVGLDTPQYVDRRVVHFSPEWKALLRHTADESRRLGLVMGMNISAGWSQTGGTWVRPEEGMKKLVWSETPVRGPARFNGALAAPPDAVGPFQNAERTSRFPRLVDQAPGMKAPAGPQTFKAPRAYRDAAVIAYRVPDAPLPAPAAVRSSAGPLDPRSLLDGDVATAVELPYAGAGPAWVELDFGRPVTVGAATVSLARYVGGAIQARGEDGRFRTVAELPGPAHEAVLAPVVPSRTYAWPATAARVWRVELQPYKPTPLDMLIGGPAPKSHRLGGIVLHGDGRVNRFEHKAGFEMVLDPEALATPARTGVPIAKADVVDLTGRLRPDGVLDWRVPEGNWVIARMGWSLTGATNAPAPPEATGLEVDKLNAAHVTRFMQGWLQPIREALGPGRADVVDNMLIDSWEAGQLNWTDDMRRAFQARRGYDPTPYLPVLTGRVVESADASDRFLWDFRRTVADLLADNQYATVERLLERGGVRLFSEASGVNAPNFQDALKNKGRVDVPMGEFWVQPPGEPQPASQTADMREAASAAHIYGKPLVAAESFTALPTVPAWTSTPASMKPVADLNLSLGLNKVIMHTSVHQPLERAPGFTLWRFGQHFSRHETWAEMARPWMDYLARSSFLLQHGKPAADIAYFYGEGVPAQAPFEAFSPGVPKGYAFDYVNAEVLLERAQVRDGRLTLPDGVSYRLLVIPDHVTRLTPGLARRLEKLVDDGLVVVGPKPAGSPGLEGGAAGDAAVRRIADRLWGSAAEPGGRRVGRGRVFSGAPLARVLDAVGLAPDFAASGGPDDGLVWIRRRAEDADLYFVANTSAKPMSLTGVFRTAGREAEFWRADTGAVEPAGYRTAGGRTSVPLALQPAESVFVVFRRPAAASERVLPRRTTSTLATVAGPWTADFQLEKGAAPVRTALPELASWTALPDPRLRHHSGSAVYARTLDAPAGWFGSAGSNRRIMLDLGRVAELAEVSVNGRTLGIAWKPPYQVDVTDALRPGANTLQVKVVNGWPNRLIGDKQPGAEPRAWSTADPYKADSPLLPSGLLGPVRVLEIKDGD